MDGPPPREVEAFKARRRGRNLAMLIAFLALAGLFYAITLVRLGRLL